MQNTSQRPIVGIPLDYHESGTYSFKPCHAQRLCYPDAVSRHGAAPILLPFEKDHIPTQLSFLSGLLLPGSEADVTSSLYGQAKHSEAGLHIPERDEYTLELIKAAVPAKLPIFGICFGHQMMNVYHGGALYQHVPEQFPSEIEHRQRGEENNVHSVNVLEGSKLAGLMDVREAPVHSMHHQAVSTLGAGLVASAHAKDGLIEALENPALPFFVGVQWHPETEISEADGKLLDAFVQAASTHARAGKKAAPVIGIIPDFEEGGSFHPLPVYILRRGYAESVMRAGGIPIFLTYDEASAEAYSSLIDGLLVPGSDHDINPSFYGAERHKLTAAPIDHKTRFEMRMAKAMLTQNKPYLGICHGMQLLNVTLGGSLIQHIPDAVPGALEHKPKDREAPAHGIEITKGSVLEAIAGGGKAEVNSSHHQGVERVGNGLKATATAPDGVVEAIEHESARFCMGVEWHPELEVSSFDRDIFKAFIQAAGSK